jgi:hypothetical protein
MNDHKSLEAGLSYLLPFCALRWHLLCCSLNLPGSLDVVAQCWMACDVCDANFDSKARAQSTANPKLENLPEHLPRGTMY